MGELTGKVAIVTGASRGIGKGIALVLAEQGATVYVTGRTVTPGEFYLPGTVGETAAECTKRGEAEGGKGIAVACDHGNDEQVAALFAQVQAEQGRLDILVNNAFQLSDDLIVKKSFWEKPLSNLEMWQVGVRSSFVAAWHAAQIMVPQGSGLIVAISGYVGVTYTFGVVFGAAKSAVDRMARDMAIELEPHNIASVSLWQGLTFTEKAHFNLGANPDMKGQTVTNPSVGSSVEHPGRVIAAMAADDKIMRLSGGTFITAEMAQLYGVTDTDGRVIPSLRAERGSPIWQPILGRMDMAMDAEKLAKLEALLDKQDITEALTRFSRGMDRLDRDLYLSAFHEDAEMAAGPFVGLASECADWAFPMHVEGQILTHHSLLNITIDLDGDTAHTETYYIFVARNKDESLVQAGGRYIDRFERRGGEWKISLRTNAIEWAGLLPNIPIPFSDVPDLYGNGAPARDKSDPSYRRPLTNLRERKIP